MLLAEMAGLIWSGVGVARFAFKECVIEKAITRASFDRGGLSGIAKDGHLF